MYSRDVWDRILMKSGLRLSLRDNPLLYDVGLRFLNENEDKCHEPWSEGEKLGHCYKTPHGETEHLDVFEDDSNMVQPSD